MNRRCLAAASLAALVCVAFVAESAQAQGGGRGRGGFGRRFGRTTHQIELAGLPEVQAELNLTDEQKTKVADLSDEFNEERRGQGFGGGGGGAEGRAERAKLNADYAAKLNEALDEVQQKRIQEVYVQVNGAAVLMDEPMVTALKITDEQQASLETALDDQRQAMRDAFQDMQDLSDEERTAKMDEINKARDEALLAVLTDEQKTEFEALKGEKLEIDMSQLRQFGRGGRGGGRRNRDRGQDDGGAAADGATTEGAATDNAATDGA